MSFKVTNLWDTLTFYSIFLYVALLYTEMHIYKRYIDV